MAAGRRRQGGSNPPDDGRQIALWKLIVGLGNPGSGYRGTRHNIGFEVLDLLAADLGVTIGTKQFGGLTGQARVDDQRIVLLKPQQYMNRSGQVAATAAGFYKLSPGSILVVTDDAALECGRIRLRGSGSAGGHNGLADIIEKLGTQQFARLRVGVGGSGDRDLAAHVLSRPEPSQRRLIESALARARDAALCWVREGVEKAMNLYNTTAPEP